MSYVSLGALGAVSSVPPTIKRGSTGTVVKQAQQLLSIKTGLGTLLLVTGTFDADTEEATKQFQSLNKDADGRALKVDGIIGPATWSALLGLASVPKPSAPPSISRAAPVTTVVKAPPAPEPPSVVTDALFAGGALSPWLVLGAMGAGAYFLLSKKKKAS